MSILTSTSKQHQPKNARHKSFMSYFGRFPGSRASPWTEGTNPVRFESPWKFAASASTFLPLRVPGTRALVNWVSIATTASIGDASNRLKRRIWKICWAHVGTDTFSHFPWDMARKGAHIIPLEKGYASVAHSPWMVCYCSHLIPVAPDWTCDLNCSLEHHTESP